MKILSSKTVRKLAHKVILAELFADYQSLPECSGKALTDVNCLSLFGDKPIHIAATRGAIEERSLLIQNGANVDEPGEHGYRPLHNAVEQGHQAAVIWLLKQVASKRLTNMRGETPGELALMLGEDQIAHMLAD